MSRTAVLTDAQWSRIESLMPSSDGSRGRPFRDHRLGGVCGLDGEPGTVAPAHVLADCLWPVLVLADYYNVDLQTAFIDTMATTTKSLTTDEPGRLPPPCP